MPNKASIRENQSIALDGEVFCWTLIAPGEPKRETVVIVPGLTSRSHPSYLSVYTDLAEVVASEGFRVVSVTTRGQFGAGGEYNFPNAVDDIAQVIINVQEEFEGKVWLIGRSAGAPIALRVARTLGPNRIAKVLLWGASTKKVYHGLFGPESDGSYLRACTEFGSSMASNFVETLFFPEEEIEYANCPVWLGIGSNDEYSSGSDQALILEQCLLGPCALFFVPLAKHAVRKGDSSWAAFRELVRLWLLS
jgi:alpha-beta hydrolase superfamily lysophospholipase